MYHVRPPVPISDVTICRQRDRRGLGALFTNRVPFWKAHSVGTPLPRVLNSPLVLGPRGPAPALGPCFFRHSLFPLTHPQHHGPHGRSSPCGIKTEPPAYEFSSADTRVVAAPWPWLARPPQRPTSHFGRPSGAPGADNSWAA